MALDGARDRAGDLERGRCASGRGLALAYLKVEHARAGQRVAVGGVGGAVAAGADSRR